MAFFMKQPCCCSPDCCGFKVCLWVLAVLWILTLFTIFLPSYGYLEYAKDVDSDTLCYSGPFGFDPITEKCGDAETYLGISAGAYIFKVVEGVSLVVTLATESAAGMYVIMAMEVISELGVFMAAYIYGLTNKTNICKGSIWESGDADRLGRVIDPKVCEDSDEQGLYWHQCIENCETQIALAVWISLIAGVVLMIYVLLVMYAYIDQLKTQDIGAPMTEIATQTNAQQPAAGSYAAPPPSYNNAPGWGNNNSAEGGTAINP